MADVAARAVHLTLAPWEVQVVALPLVAVACALLALIIARRDHPAMWIWYYAACACAGATLGLVVAHGY